MLDLGIGILWITKGLNSEDTIFCLLHFFISAFSILYYISPNIKYNETYIGLAKAVSIIAIMALIFNFIVLLFPAYIDYEKAYTAFLLLTGPAGLASITLLILFNAELGHEYRPMQVHYQYNPMLIKKHSEYI